MQSSTAINMLQRRAITYLEYTKQTAARDAAEQIQKDLYRTPGCDTADLPRLKRILLAHAARNRQIGYAQGLNYITAALLSNRPPTADEAEAFWLLCAITELLLPGYYAPSLIGVRTDGRVLDVLIRESRDLCDLLAIFDEAGFELEVVTPHWLMLAFVETLPRDTHLLRVWDLLMSTGARVLLATAMAILHCQAPRLRAAGGVDFGECYMLLRSPEPAALSTSRFFGALARELRALPDARFHALRREHRPVVPPREDEIRRYRNTFRDRGRVRPLMHEQ